MNILIKYNTNKHKRRKNGKKTKKISRRICPIGVFLGLLGIHKFYAERFTQAFTMLALFLGSIICLAIAGFCAYNNMTNPAGLFGVIGAWLFLDVMIWTWVDFIVGLCNANNPDRLFNK